MAAHEDKDEEQPGKAPLLLITGFLGSGKTTLINRFLRERTGKRLGVVVNEFGQVGIDGALLSPGDIVEISDGCVCCARGTELWETALELRDRAGATHLVIETSGIADPEELLRQYEVLPQPLRERLELCGVLCIADALHLPEAARRRAEARQQVRHADRLLLSKVDLCDAAALAAAHRALDELGGSRERVVLRPDAPARAVAETLDWALAPSASRRPVPERQHHPGEHPHRPRHEGQLAAISMREQGPLLRAPLLALLHEMPGEVLRVKGFVRLLEPGAVEPSLAVLELAGRRVELRPCTAEQAGKAPPDSTLVFIGEGLDAAEAWLRLRLSACRVPLQPPDQRHVGG